ncbi:uracil-DNA glycosylase family protein [Sphingomonas montana]|uniref:uracil-DNA glycosylase family protein n=1 Tax=Sphingomonas montana TaxID=1843236 RepID=UPI00096ECDCD|nr:uracil-DNA glycosylase family protein [Sphingomonas montana]
MDGFAETLGALRWWRDAGVDMLVDDEPRDWLRPAAQVAPVAPPVLYAPAPTPDDGTAPPLPTVGDARAAVALPDTLAAYAAWCADPATFPELGPQRVCAAGDPASGLMILGDMPEPGDADAGVLMSGDLGRLFDHILAAIGRDRASVYLAAICPARPAGGRIAPATAAGLVAAARHHVALAAPRVLLLLGKEAITAFGLDWPGARGHLHEINHIGGKTVAIATFHPRMLPQSPARKADLWADLRLLLQELDR